ncbi:MAG TPA: hypothetical protein VG186_13720 [Solirubrobacteraceae bacterium]|jgi:hypothetical protein|nr:hypothetical protein [Solirubrobacteraceae bacterium]
MNTYRPHEARPHETTLAPGRRELHHRDTPCPPHTWDCPVVMKLDPLALAWTCGSCGAITTTPIGMPRPHGSAAPAG